MGFLFLFFKNFFLTLHPVSSVTKIPFSVLVSTRLDIVALTAIILYSLPVLPDGGTGFFCV